MRIVTAVLFVGVLALGVMGCEPGGPSKAPGKAPAKVQGCKKCGKAPCVCKPGAKGSGKKGSGAKGSGKKGG